MHAMEWIILVVSVVALHVGMGWLVYLVGAKHGFSEGWDTGRDALRDDFQYRRKQLDKMYAECQAQRDEAQGEIAAAHVERDRLAEANRINDGVNRDVLERCERLMDDNDRIKSECERLARCLDSLVLDLDQIEIVAHSIARRSDSMKGRMVVGGSGVTAGGRAVGDDGPGDEDDEPEDEDEDDMDEDDDLDIDDYDEDDYDDDTCPDCGEDWDDCDCDDDDDDDLGDDESEDD